MMPKPAVMRAAALLLSLLLMMPGLPVRAESHVLYQLRYAEHAVDACTTADGNLYLLTNQGLHRFDLNNGAHRSAAPEELALIALASHGDRLYALTDQLQPMMLAGDAWQPLFQAAMPDEPVSQARLCAAPGKLYYSYRAAGGQLQLVSLDLADGKQAPHPPFDALWCAWDPAGERLIGPSYEETTDTWHLTAVAAGTDERAQLFPLPSQRKGGGLAFDPESGYLYVKEGGSTKRLGMDGQAHPLFGVPWMQALTPLGDGRFAGIRDGRLGLLTAREQPVGRLSVLGFASSYNQDFMVKSGINIEELDPWGGEAYAKLATAMATQDGSVDFYAFDTKEGLKAVKDKGYYVDLSQSATLAQAAEELYPALSRAIRQGEQIAAWPVDAEVTLRTHDQEFFEEQQLSPPECWEGALDLIQELAGRGYFEQSGAAPFDLWRYSRADMLRYLVQEYLLAQAAEGNVLRFDSLVFRRLAERIIAQVPLEDPYPRVEGYEPTVFSGTQAGAEAAQAHAPLKLHPLAKPVIHMNAKVLVINPYSPNREAALQYLEYLAEKRTPEDYGLYQSMRQPMEDRAVQQRIQELEEEIGRLRAQPAAPEDRRLAEQRIATLSSELLELEPQRYIVSQESIDSIHSFAPSFLVLEDALILYNEKLGKLVDRLVAGGLTLDGFISEADAYVRLVEQERGQ